MSGLRMRGISHRLIAVGAGAVLSMSLFGCASTSAAGGSGDIAAKPVAPDQRSSVMTAGGGLAMSAGGVAASSGRNKVKQPVVWAHRGASKKAPEATIAAYRQALRDGADVLEGDIAQSKDGVLVVVHDDTLTRNTNVEEVFPDRAPWNVRDFTVAEMKQLDAGSWWDESYAGEKILTLREWIRFNNRRAGLAPELKNPDVYPGIVQNLAAELTRWGYTNDTLKAKNGEPQIWVQSFSPAALKQFAELLPDVPLFALVSGYTYLNGTDEVLTDVATWADAIAGNPALSRASQIDRAKSYGLTVVSEVNDSPELIRAASAQGYDVVFTNLADVAKAQLSGRDALPRRGAIVIDTVLYNPEGDDVAEGAGEYVALRNTSARSVDISGLTLRDFGNNLLRVADDAVIEPGSRYFAYVGAGTDRVDAHFNGLGSVFGNTGTDHAYLYDGRKILDVYSYIA